jgi:hypothetical protein
LSGTVDGGRRRFSPRPVVEAGVETFNPTLKVTAEASPEAVRKIGRMFFRLIILQVNSSPISMQ